jgi:hypothetical protein
MLIDSDKQGKSWGKNEKATDDHDGYFRVVRK